MNSEFENQLQRQPVREVPQHWRARIMAAAQPQPSGWREWFWPCPKAWAVLGAAWVVILALNFTAPGEPRFADISSLPESAAIWQQQTLMMAQLLGPPDVDELPAALPAPKPRSDRERRQLIG